MKFRSNTAFRIVYLPSSLDGAGNAYRLLIKQSGIQQFDLAMDFDGESYIGSIPALQEDVYTFYVLLGDSVKKRGLLQIVSDPVYKAHFNKREQNIETKRISIFEDNGEDIFKEFDVTESLARVVSIEPL